MRVGLNDTFSEAGTIADLYRKHGLDGPAIVSAVKSLVLGTGVDR